MRRFRLAVATLALALCVALTARAAEPPHFTYAPAPPGAIVQSRVVYLAGESMHAQWRAVLSKAEAGRGNGTTFYQWYFSLYAIDGTTYRLKYRSPRDGAPFAAVARAHGAALWFPVAQARISGVGELMAPGVQQVVVESHEAAADCGLARVDVFAYDGTTRKVAPALSVENGCELHARLVNGPRGAALAVTGPYYGPNAALCCPTKNAVTAIFRFRNGRWRQQPRYFKVLPSR
jgi:hypothetical protein